MLNKEEIYLQFAKMIRLQKSCLELYATMKVKNGSVGMKGFELKIDAALSCCKFIAILLLKNYLLYFFSMINEGLLKRLNYIRILDG